MIRKHQEIISMDIRQKISTRYQRITSAVNREFWGINSEQLHSFFVGSYGRGTAIDTSDLDILVELPTIEFNRYNYCNGNGQSRLLQAVRFALINTYPNSDIRADGQIIKINFTDSIKFEILPAFKNENSYYNSEKTYIYPDSNMGGNWKSTNPKKEQSTMKEKNKGSNGLLFDTCKHIRYIRDTYYKSYHLSGILIDSFVFEAINSWRWVDGEGASPVLDYEKYLYEYFIQKKDWYNYYGLSAPGSNQNVECRDDLVCLNKVLYKIKTE